ncbi:surface carbohydrate biosynthesis protein [Dongia sp.]|uniref:surface carbohydrate biosynthesis protein n=1 Tax=Dongia sp. TaxID=1977262 RepID=UPI0035AFD118
MPMEIASRELDSRLLLATLALARGFEVVLGQKWLIERNVDDMPPGIYLSKTLTQRDARAMARAKEKGYLIAAIEEEVPGLVTKPDELRWIADEAVRTADAIFIGGETNAQAMKTRFPYAADHVFKTLNPRWDLLRPNLRHIHDGEADAIRARYGRFILINTNFGWTNSEKGPAEFMVQEQARQGKIDLSTAETRQFLDDFLRMERENHTAIVSIVEQVLASDPDVSIVLRPHPSERLQTWTEHFAGSKRLLVVREGPSVPWIMASELLIHTNCTTGVEAIGLDKPALCVQATTSPVVARYLANRVNPVASSIAEGVEMILKHLSGKQRIDYSPAMRSCFVDSMSFSPDHLGAEQIIDQLESLVRTREGGASVGSKCSAWRTSWDYQWNLKDKNVRGTLFPDFSNAQILASLTRMARTLDINLKPSVYHCGSKVVLLTEKKLGAMAHFRQFIGSTFK